MKLKFEKPFGPLDEKVVSALEQYWGFKLPTQYRDFLLAANGGKPLKTLFELKDITVWFFEIKSLQ
jgi:hypothetical protein